MASQGAMGSTRRRRGHRGPALVSLALVAAAATQALTFIGGSMRPAAPAQLGRPLLGLVARAAGVSLAEVKEKVMDLDISKDKGKNQKVSAILVELIEKLEEALKEDVDEAPKDHSEAEATFAKLLELNDEADREDFYDARTDEWDLEGLADDLRLAEADAKKAAEAQAVSQDANSEAEIMLAKLLAVDPRVSREDYWDEEANEWDLEGLSSDLKIAEAAMPAAAEEAAAEAPAAAAKEDDEAAGLFAKLAELDSAVDKEDYYDPNADEWDVEGLQEDLRLAEGDAAKAAAKPASKPSPRFEARAAPAAVEGTDDSAAEGEAMMAKLLKLDSSASKEDYWDEEASEWDIEGLSSDLKIAEGNAGDEAKASGGGEGETMIAELMKLDSRVNREDYWDDDAHEWDLEGLESDLQIAKQSAGGSALDGGEALFAELAKLDQAASREDYLDGDEWDLEGLKDDIALAQQ